MSEASNQHRQPYQTMSPYPKGLTTYLKILAVISTILLCISMTFTDSLVIYTQTNKPSVLQVFFPIDGTYSEKNSVQFELTDKASTLIIRLPTVPVDHVRIDPSNESGEIVITKIELKHLFGTETYTPKDLITRTKPILMIDRLEATPSGFSTRSTGNDPAFELQLDKPSTLYPLIIYSLLLSLVVLLILTLWHKREEPIKKCFKSIMPAVLRQNFSALVSIVIVWGLILYAIYPGFMSYDSFHALREARGTVQGGTYPPFVSYVWRIFDFVWPGPTFMMIAQNFLLLFSIGVLLKKLNYSDKAIVLLITFIAWLPPILGTMIVVWKDVSVAACFCASIACFKSAETNPYKNFLISLGIIFLFCGAAFRFNAISGVLPLLMWLSYKRFFSKWGMAKSCLSSFIIFVAILGGVNSLNSYRFPSFEKLAPNKGFDVIMAYDLVGISVVRSKTVDAISDLTTGKPIAIEYLKNIYEPRHINITIDNDKENRIAFLKSASSSNLRKTWFSEVANNPLAYLKHRTTVFSQLIGATAMPMFYPTHGRVDQNELGITQHPNKLTTLLLKYISGSSYTLMCKPWFYYLIGFMTLVFATALKRKIDLVTMFFIFLSGILYISPFFFIAPAADLRYNLWAVTAMLITLLIALAPNSVKDTI